jgi:hypothetical protein
MEFAPRHDWDFFEAKRRKAHAARLRAISDEQAWNLYVSMFDLATSQSASLPSRVAASRWNEKLATRRKLVAAFSKLDEFNGERGPANNSGGRDAVAS